MPFVRVRILRGKQQLGAPAKMWPLTTIASVVLESALATYDTYDDGKLLLCAPLELYPSKDERLEQVTQLEEADLPDATLAMIDEQGFGWFWLARVQVDEEGSPSFRTPSGAASSASNAGSSRASSSFMRSAFEEIDTRGKRVLPTRSVVGTFDGPVFNALLDLLDSCSLLWDPVDAQDSGSGLKLLIALSKALAYLIPFELNGALGRRSLQQLTILQPASGFHPLGALFTPTRIHQEASMR